MALFILGDDMAQYDGSIRINTKIDSKEASAQLMALENRIVKTADKIASLRSKMDALKDTKIPTQEYKEISNQLEKAETEFNKLLEKQEQMQREGKDNGVAWDRLDDKMEQVGGTIQSVKGELQYLVDTGKAFTLGSGTEEYAKMHQQLQYLESDYTTLIQRRNEFEQRNAAQPDGYERLRNSISELGNSFYRVTHPIESMKASFSSAAESMKEKAAGIAASAINGIAHPLQTIRSVAGSATSGTARLLSGMVSAAKKAGSAISNLSSLLKKATVSMFGFGKSTKSTNGMLNGGLKSILKYGLGIRSLYALISRLRSAVKEGFGNLAQYSKPVNASLSSLKSALTQFKNSLATAFSPILTAIAPALTTLINMASKAATAVGMLIAALSGQKTFTKAATVQENYAESLKKTASAAKKTDKEQKKQLSSLDKLNNLTSDTDKDFGDSNGETGGISSGDMFETVDISSKIGDLAKMIKEAWKNADFTEVGSLIGAKLKDALDNIPWEEIQNTAAKVGKSLATLINGFVEVSGLGYTIGNTTAQAINTGLVGINKFAKNLHWDSIGRFIADGINGALENIDWDTALSAAHYLGTGIATMLNNALTPRVFNNIGRTIGMGINTALTFANDFLTTFDFKTFGSNVAKGIETAIETIDWELLGDTIANALNALFDTFGGFVTDFPWSEFGSNVGDSLTHAITGFKWADAGKSLGTFVSGLFDAIKSFIDKTKWEKLGKGITTSISSFFGNIKWSSISGTISSFASGLFDFLSGLINGIEWEFLPENIIGAIVDFFSGFDYAKTFGSIGELIGNALIAALKLGAGIFEQLFNLGWNIGEGITNGIGESFSNIGKWVKENIFNPFINGFKNAFGIHSPSVVMKEQGKYIISGLLNGLKDNISSVLAWLGNIPTWFKDKFFLAYKNAKNAFSGAKQYFSGVWSNIKSAFSNISSWFKNTFSAAWTAVKNVFSSGGKVFNGIKDGILSGLKSVINALIDGINKVIKTPFDGLNTALKKVKSIKIAGAKPFDGLPDIDVPQIPKLATGAVIPPNKEFLAVLGDQKHGTNIEAPLSTIEKAVENALNRNGGTGGLKELTIHIPIEVEGKTLFDIIKKIDLEQYRRTGKPSFQM